MPIEMRVQNSEEYFLIKGSPHKLLIVSGYDVEAVIPNARAKQKPSFTDTLNVEEFPIRRAPDPQVAGIVTYFSSESTRIESELIRDDEETIVHGIIFRGIPFGTPVAK